MHQVLHQSEEIHAWTGHLKWITADNIESFQGYISDTASNVEQSDEETNGRDKNEY